MSLRTYSFSVEWYILTTGMVICLIISIGCIIIQSRSISWYTKKINCDAHKNCKKNNNLQRRTLFFLYMVYFMACLCSIQCFLCHISDTFPSSYYCEYGMPICVILYVGAKSFLYGFFIERAKATQNMIITNVKNSSSKNNKTTSSNYYKLPNEIIFDYILPIYIFIYFWTFFILCLIYFRGKVFTINEDDNINHDRNIMITGCLFYEYKQWLFILGAIIDVINSIGLLYLFLKPLYLTIDTHKKYLDSYSIQSSNSNDRYHNDNDNEHEQDHENEHEHEQEQDGLNDININNLNFSEMVKNEIINSEIDENNKMDFEQEKNDLLQMITTIKINLLCTMLSTISCIAFFLLMAFSKIIGIEQYLWFLGNIDLMINSLSTFIMLKPNRSYTSQIIFCGCFNWSCIKCINCKCKMCINIINKLSSFCKSNKNNNDKDKKDTTKQHVRVSSNEKIDHEHSAISTEHLSHLTLKHNDNPDRDRDRNRIKSHQQQPSY